MHNPLVKRIIVFSILLYSLIVQLQTAPGCCQLLCINKVAYAIGLTRLLDVIHGRGIPPLPEELFIWHMNLVLHDTFHGEEKFC